MIILITYGDLIFYTAFHLIINRGIPQMILQEKFRHNGKITRKIPFTEILCR